MTARQDLLQAARSLTATGHAEFSPAQLIDEARRRGSTYPDSTLRTHIVGPMCANSPDNHAVKWGDLVRIGHGRYRLANQSTGPAPTLSEVPPRRVAQPEDSTEPSEVDPHEEWHWEGNVQAAVVTHLAANGWQIRSVADTASRQHGYDIDAVRNGRRLLVEVKGFPSDRYTRGPKRGQPKPTSPNVQARHWYASAVLTGLLARDDDPDANVVLAFPAFETYRSLAQRTRASLSTTGINVWLVRRDGTVTARGA